MSKKVLDLENQTARLCPPIILRNGKSIIYPLAAALAFIQNDGSYQKYDEAFVPQDNVLTRSDVLISRKIIARTCDRVINDVLKKAGPINAALAGVPISANLEDNDPPWDALAKLYSTLVTIPQIRISRATKILHKKRPCLIPILDNEVAKYLRSIEPSLTTDRIAEGLALTQSYKKELDRNVQSLKCVRKELHKRGFELTEVRLLDILIWAHSGVYSAPYLRRREGSSLTPHSSEQPIVIAADRLEAAVGILTEFRNDETGYLSWAAANPNGFIANVDEPATSPLYPMVHRATHRAVTSPVKTNYTTGKYFKVCSNNMEDLERWARRERGRSLTLCSICMKD